MTRHLDRPGIVLAAAKHLQSIAGANTPGATFRHEVSPAGDGRFSEFDESLFNLCGLKGTDVVADATVLFDAIHPDDLADLEHALAPDDDDTGNRRFEIRILGPDGEPRWFHGLCWPQLRVAGAAVRDGLLIDITDRKRQEARERANDFAAQSSDWFWETDTDHRFTFMGDNPAAATEDVIGKRREDFLDVETEAEKWGEYFATLEHRQPFKNFTYFRTDREGERIWVSITGKPLFDDAGTFLGYRGIARDVTPEMQEHDKLRTEAQIDELTGLANRRAFHAGLEATLSTRNRRRGPFALVFLDLDGFKQVNDTMGHQAGDAVLIEVGARMVKILRGRDLVARLGDDEFAVLLPEIHRPDDTSVIVNKLLDAIHRPVGLPGGASMHVGASIGVAIFPDDGDDALSLVEAADRAMYEVKKYGKNAIKLASEVPV